MAAEVELFDDLDAVARDAGGALDRASQPCLFHRLDWFRLVEAHCPPPGRLVAIRSKVGSRHAWLFLAVEGETARPWSSWYSLRFDAAGSREDDVMAPLGRVMREAGIATVELEPIADPAPLERALAAAGWLTRREPAKANWRIDTEGMDFETYWAGRPKRLRNTARRRSRGGDIQVRIHQDFDAQAWADYEAVYRASWKPEEGSFPFLRDLAWQEGVAGTLRLGLAYIEGAPVAAQLWLTENGEAVIHKLAYAESARDRSPGTILSMEMFRFALDEDRVKRIDYGTGDEAYKADWMGQRRMLWRLRAFNPARLSGLAGAARAAASDLAARLRSR